MPESSSFTWGPFLIGVPLEVRKEPFLFLKYTKVISDVSINVY